ncbi:MULTISPECIES: phosphodiester glycosidase family protein [unclassified Mesorhizobium]|uniref:phosphodiester glycosidase family protein n=1 Tax=unclassified Mesorhizobium TaxID=325217 RepID=UPI0011265E5B|nr:MULTISPECIES: phosphodiester glycosidase family protein [unclassified Mesorhizobium]TPK63952.1 phosphodiester glycosidase family protein [Mesorhizobium sp. B2-5-1]TPM55891.1 phosphodiester glycosidase family protein [Mesorhizobium sp. B2-1-9]TPM82122.1 phosphodiester glycosidase family protein [Mesorhizobium sp. B2-1-4]TPN11834.1 phosphodiester glycosidase family protein [Mesorhizobium sp. B2-1-2]UCI11748.1 phosphodiester glycosidase family protein [Mesorhizobium sp. B2-1-1]
MDLLTVLQSAPLLLALIKTALPSAAAIGMGVGQWFASLPPCRDFVFEVTSYLVCEVDPRQYRIELFWKDPAGKPYQSLHNLDDAQRRAGRTMLFAINAGMYHPNLAPVGLYVERGQELASAKVGSGSGNFSLQPNAIFYISDGKAAVRATRDFLEKRPPTDYATQSGPMLVINGKLHQKFRADSTSRKTRDGVGVRKDGVVVFAISNGTVTFHAFARLFRDGLGCDNALFLDGSISSLLAPAIGRNDDYWNLGPMIGVFRR